MPIPKTNSSPQPAILSTMDIIMDGFGLMLSFGDLAWLVAVGVLCVIARSAGTLRVAESWCR